MLVIASNFLGIPESQVPALEAIYQAVLTELYDKATALFRLIPERRSISFGDADYSIRIVGTPERFLMLVRDCAAGWWAVLDVTEDRFRVQFKILGSSEDPPPQISTFDFTDALDSLSKADVWVEAGRRDSPNWRSSMLRLDFRHPLLYILQETFAELQKEKSL